MASKEFRIVHKVGIDAPLRRCFDMTRNIGFHADSSEIRATPVGGKISGLSENGDETVWSARFFGIRFFLKTQISGYKIDRGYRENMIEGSLKEFSHDYNFKKTDSGCILSDTFVFRSRFGILGAIVDKLLIRNRMSYLVRRRLERIKGASESEEWRKYL